MNPHHCRRLDTAIDRRDFLRKSAFGFGAAAMGSLLARDASAELNPLAPKAPHFPA